MVLRAAGGPEGSRCRLAALNRPTPLPRRRPQRRWRPLKRATLRLGPLRRARVRRRPLRRARVLMLPPGVRLRPLRRARVRMLLLRVRLRPLRRARVRRRPPSPQRPPPQVSAPGCRGSLPPPPRMEARGLRGSAADRAHPPAPGAAEGRGRAAGSSDSGALRIAPLTARTSRRWHLPPLGCPHGQSSASLAGTVWVITGSPASPSSSSFSPVKASLLYRPPAPRSRNPGKINQPRLLTLFLVPERSSTSPPTPQPSRSFSGTQLGSWLRGQPHRCCS